MEFCINLLMVDNLLKYFQFSYLDNYMYNISFFSRRGSLIVKNSNESEWIFIIRSVSYVNTHDNTVCVCYINERKLDQIQMYNQCFI